MRKFLKEIVLTTIIFLCSSCSVYATIIPITPENGSELWEKEGEFWTVNYEWENTDADVEYVYFLVRWEEGSPGTKVVTKVGTDTNILKSVRPYGVYCWQVRYHPKDTYVDDPGGFVGDTDFESDVFRFSVMTEIEEEEEEEGEEEVSEEDVEEKNESTEEVESKDEKKEEKEDKEETEEKEKEKEKEKEEREDEVLIPAISVMEETKERYRGEEFDWNVGKVLGERDVMGGNVVVKYNTDRKEVSIISSDVPKLTVGEKYSYPVSNVFSTYVSGTLPSSLNFRIDFYECEFKILDPKSWFRCQERFVETKEVFVKPNVFWEMYQNNLYIPIRSYIQDGSSFEMLAGHSSNIDGLNLRYVYKTYLRDVGLYYEHSGVVSLKTEIKNTSSTKEKPFVFPFQKNIGVTQWYGYTNYQNPHTGIDFGSRKEHILAVGDGEVIAIGWDDYFGDCLSGGNYIKIKQDNGMYTVYFHLDSMLVDTGDFVEKGQIIGVSGNTGFFNCQPLGYHLHFETRENVSFGSHVDPVKYIGVDWGSIPTLGYKQFPGRLSGNNPHPGF